MLFYQVAFRLPLFLVFDIPVCLLNYSFPKQLQGDMVIPAIQLSRNDSGQVVHTRASGAVQFGTSQRPALPDFSPGHCLSENTWDIPTKFLLPQKIALNNPHASTK